VGARNTIVLQEGHAVIGEALAVNRVAAYALGALARERAPMAPTLSVDLARLVAAYRGTLDGLKATLSGAGAVAGMVGWELGALDWLAAQTDRVELTIDVQSDEAALELALVPRAGGVLARFLRVQRPLDGTLLGMLAQPPDAIPSIMAGNMQMGPPAVRDEMTELVRPLLETVIGAPLEGETRKKWDEVVGLLTGEVAAATWGGGDLTKTMELEEVVGATDGKRAAVLGWELFGRRFEKTPATFELMGLRMKLSARTRTATDGVTVHAFDLHLDADPQAGLNPMLLQKAHIVVAGVDKAFLLTMGDGADAQMDRLLAASQQGRGTIAIPPAARRALEDARARKETGTMFVNLLAAIPFGHAREQAAQASSGMTMSCGFTDGSAHLRFALPAAHLRELSSAF
jgi:hypothetical protein